MAGSLLSYAVDGNQSPENSSYRRRIDSQSFSRRLSSFSLRFPPCIFPAQEARPFSLVSRPSCRMRRGAEGAPHERAKDRESQRQGEKRGRGIERGNKREAVLDSNFSDEKMDPLCFSRTRDDGRHSETDPRRFRRTGSVRMSSEGQTAAVVLLVTEAAGAHSRRPHQRLDPRPGPCCVPGRRNLPVYGVQPARLEKAAQRNPRNPTLHHRLVSMTKPRRVHRLPERLPERLAFGRVARQFFLWNSEYCVNSNRSTLPCFVMF